MKKIAALMLFSGLAYTQGPGPVDPVADVVVIPKAACELRRNSMAPPPGGWRSECGSFVIVGLTAIPGDANALLVTISPMGGQAQTKLVANSTTSVVFQFTEDVSFRSVWVLPVQTKGPPISHSTTRTQ